MNLPPWETMLPASVHCVCRIPPVLTWLVSSKQFAVLVRSAPLCSPFRRCCSRIYLQLSKIPLPGASIFPSDPLTSCGCTSFYCAHMGFSLAEPWVLTKAASVLYPSPHCPEKMLLTPSELRSATSGFLMSYLSSVPGGQLFLPGFLA